MAARVQALDAYAHALRGIDVTDPVALADATRDVAGLLGAHALAATDPRAIETLTRAARTAGRACQTHRRPAPAAEVSEVVSVGARLALSAVINKHADPVILVIQALALVEALAECYVAAGQARTAAEMLASSRAALAAISTPTTVSDIEQLRSEAAYQALAGTAGEMQTGHYPAAAASTQQVGEVREPQRELVAAGASPAQTGTAASSARSSGVQAGHGLSERQIAQLRNTAALAMPASSATSQQSVPARQQAAGVSSATSSQEKGARDTGGVSSSEVERARRIYQNALSPTHPTTPAPRGSAADGDEQSPVPRQPGRHDHTRRQGRNR